MKKIILFVALVAGTTIGYAQQSVCRGTAPTIIMAGHFNSTSLTGGSRSTTAIASTTWKASLGQNMLYTKKDTVTDTGVDTFKATLTGAYNSVYTWCNATSISGTNTSCVVKLWVSGDGSAADTYVAVYTATVSATNPVGYHLVNSGNGWPYGKFFWTYTGVGTHSTSWQGGVLIR